MKHISQFLTYKPIKRIVHGLLFFFATLMLFSCDSFLNITPLNSIVMENYWEKESEVNSVVMSCYFNMEQGDFMRRVILWSEVRSDNLTEGSGLTLNEELNDFYTNNLNSSNSNITWAPFYKVINLCNTVLYYAPRAQKNDGNFSVDELKAYEAEVKSIRALCYFYLIRSFQKVPLVTQATIGDDENFQVAASSEEEVLTQITSDLSWSLDYIWGNNYFDNDASKKGRITLAAVQSILADVYLWKGDYDNCAKYCDDVINDKKAEKEAELLYSEIGDFKGYPLLKSTTEDGVLHYAYTSIFGNKNSYESIFELQFDENILSNQGVSNYYGGIANINPGLFSSAFYLINQGSSDLFSNKTDVRLTENVNYTGTALKLYAVNKYRVANWSSTETAFLRSTASNWILYRLTDIMLMKAEALAYSNKNPEETINLVKAVNFRSCKDTTKLTYDPTNLKELVLSERQRELMFEGKRWYDLVRMVRHSTNPTQMMSTLRSTYLMRRYQANGSDIVNRLGSVNTLYLPIAQSEINTNPLLEEAQNPAYK